MPVTSWGRDHRRALVVALLSAVVAGCTSTRADPPATTPSTSTTLVASTTTATAAAATTTLPPTTTTTWVDPTSTRPFRVIVPTGADHARPLVLALHGYSNDADRFATFLHLEDVAVGRDAIVAVPNGISDARGNRFWNASDACCDRDHRAPDDSAYLLHVIESVEHRYRIDPARVYVIGHSNGGFMAYRLACDHADVITAIVSIAGAMPNDAAGCRPSRPVSVLQIHGTTDGTILYSGGTIFGGNRYPSARTSVADWAAADGCSPRSGSGGRNVDLDRELGGAETTRAQYDGCTDGTTVALWSIVAGTHTPLLGPVGRANVFDWLFARSRV